MAGKSQEPRIVSLDEFLAVRPREKVVEIPRLGGGVRIREWTKAREMEMRQEARRPDGTRDGDYLELLMVVEAVVDPRLSAEHVEQLRQMPGDLVSVLMREIIRLNGDSAEAAEKAAADFRPEPAG